MTRKCDPVLERLQYLQPKRVFIYKKEHSFILFFVFLSVFVIVMMSYHLSYWEYSKEKLLQDPVGFTMGFYHYTASVWISVGMFVSPILAAACLFDYLGLIDSYLAWELSPRSRQGRRRLISALRRKGREGMADLSDWLTSLQKDRR